MRIVLDVDGVLADFSGHVLRTLQRKGYQVPDHATEWRFIDALPARAQPVARTFLKSSKWWRGIPPMAGATRAVKQFRAMGHQVVFASADYASCPGWTEARRNWLIEHVGAQKCDLVVAARKELVRGDLYVDDKPENVQAIIGEHAQREWTPGVWLFAHPYNRDHGLEAGPSPGQLTGEIDRWTDQTIFRLAGGGA